jgi:adenine deaminase
MKLEIREGSVVQGLSTLIKPILRQGLDTHHCLLATDDIHPRDLLEEGHMDRVVRRAIEEGVAPVRAIQMASINTAEHFGVSELGSISPGKAADMIAVKDLHKFKVDKVFVNGALAARDGKLLIQLPRFAYPKFARESVRLRRKLTPRDFIVRPGETSGKIKVRVILVREGEIITGCEVMELEVKDGEVVPDPARDILRVAVVERYRKTGNVGLGFVKGFGIKEGALASSVGHDAHNIIVVGIGRADMVCAVNEIVRLGGGLVVALNGRTIAELGLPIAGLMSDKSTEEVSAELEKLHLAANRLGAELKSPFMTMAFLSLAVIPKLRVTDKGLVDVEKFKLVEPIIEIDNRVGALNG